MRVVAIAVLCAATTGSSGALSAINCKSPANQMEIDQCAGRDFQTVDARLNRLYRSMIARYDAADQGKLKAAEKSWIAYRDAECQFETNGTAGGTINSTMFTRCRIDKTNARIRDLNAQLHCGEGDLSCNAPTK